MKHENASMGVEEFLEHAGWVRRLARQLVRDQALADDVVQEAWLAAVRRPPEAGVSVRSWLGGVVRNTVAQMHRGERRRVRREEAVAALEGGGGLAPDELSQRLEGQRLLVETVAKLEEPFRSTVLLRYFEGLSAAAIGRRLRVPAATVRWRLMRGLDLLRERLDGEHGGDRRRWCVLLIPIAGNPLIMATAASALVQGVKGAIAMKTGTKVAGVATLLLITSAGFVLFERSKEEPIPATPVRVAVATTDPETSIAHQAGAASEPEAATLEVERFKEGDAKEAPASLGRWLEVAGRCIDPDGRPLGDVAVTEARLGSALSARSGADGRFGYRLDDGALIDALAIGSDGVQGRFVASASGRERVALIRTVRLGATTDLGDIVMERGGSIRGRVVTASGEPVRGAIVTPTSPDQPSGPRQTGFVAGGRAPSPRPDGNPLGGLVRSLVEQMAERVAVEAMAETLGGGEGGIGGILADQVTGPPVATESAQWNLPSAKSGPDGTFHLEGVREGPCRLDVRKASFNTMISDLIDVKWDSPATGVIVRLDRAEDPEWRVEGVVVDPDGEPHGDALVEGFFHRKDGSKVNSFRRVDEQGRFAFAANEPGTWTFSAHTVDARFGGAFLEGVGRETEAPIELRLVVARAFRVRIVDARGAPVTDYTVALDRPNRPVGGIVLSSPLGSHTASNAADGVLSVKAPIEPFMVVVDAEGFATLRLGPFDPASLPEEIAGALDPIRGIEGLVDVDGGPASAATVIAHRVAADDTTVILNRFPSWVGEHAVTEGTTGDDGRYRLTVREAGTYVVEARGAGRPPAFSRPFDYDPGRGGTCDVSLVAGGALEGRVLIGAPRSPAGMVVGISQGGPDVRSQRVGEDGVFRFEDLTPGPWMVKLLSEEISTTAFSQMTMKAHREPLPFDVLVRSGQTSRLDVDAGQGPGSVVIEGRFLYEGLAEVTWSVGVAVALEGMPHATQLIGGTIDDDGRFRVALDAPAEGHLTFKALGASRTLAVVTQPIDVKTGVTTWSKTMVTGTLRGRISGGTSGEDLVHFHRGEGGLEVETPLGIGEDGRIDDAVVPAGKGEIRAPGRWRRTSPPRARVDVPAGGVGVASGL
jgi:RNA polymerase sigma-70 factor (ECF subfamily)